MIQDLFVLLSNAINGTAAIALLASFGWGVLSILLSPCHLSSIPLIVGFISDRNIKNSKQSFILALLFSTGILVSIAIIGLLTGLAGRMMGDLGPYGNYFVAIIFFLVGLYLLGVINLPFLSTAVDKPGIKTKGFFAAFLLGLIFGIALGPCSFAYMMPMLGVVFSIASTKIFFALALVLAYGIGHCSIIVIAGTSTKLVQKYLNWNRESKAINILKKVSGIFVIMGGLYLIYLVN